MEGYSQLDRSIIKYVDRVGRHGNVDNGRFDRIVDEWQLSDDFRNPGLELYGLGAQLIAWIRSRKTDIVAAAFLEMEDVLTENADENQLTIEVFDGMQAALLDFMRDDVDGGKSASSLIVNLMGDETKQIWIPMWSETEDLLRRRGNL
jgi:hypothetical protein